MSDLCVFALAGTCVCAGVAAGLLAEELHGRASAVVGFAAAALLFLGLYVWGGGLQ